MPLFVTLLALKRLGSATQKQIAEVTGQPQQTVSWHLKQLTVAEKTGRNVQNQPVKVYQLSLPRHKAREV